VAALVNACGQLDDLLRIPEAACSPLLVCLLACRIPATSAQFCAPRLLLAPPAPVTAASGVSGTASPFSPKALRASPAPRCISRLAECRCQFFSRNARRQVRTVASSAHDSRPVGRSMLRPSPATSLRYSRPGGRLVRTVALLVGNEGAGLPEEVERSADARIRIPMSSGIESLNAAAAAASLLRSGPLRFWAAKGISMIARHSICLLAARERYGRFVEEDGAAARRERFDAAGHRMRMRGRRCVRLLPEGRAFVATRSATGSHQSTSRARVAERCCRAGAQHAAPLPGTRVVRTGGDRSHIGDVQLREKNWQRHSREHWEMQRGAGGSAQRLRRKWTGGALTPEAAVTAPVAPKADAVRKIVPTLPGSCTPASTTRSGSTRLRNTQQVVEAGHTRFDQSGHSLRVLGIGTPSKRRSVVRKIGMAISGRSISGRVVRDGARRFR